jgi:hypothetical protein
VNIPIYDFKNHRLCSESFRKVLRYRTIEAMEDVGDDVSDATEALEARAGSSTKGPGFSGMETTGHEVD